MSVILQTMITNKLNQKRRITWTDRPVVIEGNSAVIVDGAYPTGCPTPQKLRQFHNELSQGWTEVTIITNLPTAKPMGSGAVVTPSTIVKTEAAAPKKHKPTTTETKETNDGVQINKIKVNAQQGERFKKIDSTADENPLLPQEQTLPGHEHEIAQPVTKELFPDGKLRTAEEANAEKAVKAAPAPKAEPAAEEVAKGKKTPAKKTAAKKKAPAKKATAKKAAEGDASKGE